MDVQLDMNQFQMVEPAAKALLKQDYKIDFEQENGIEVTAALGCGKTIEYRQRDDGAYDVWDGSLSLKVPDDVFPFLFRPIALNKEYLSLEEATAEIAKGGTFLIQNFESDIMIHAGVIKDDAGYTSSYYCVR